MERWFADLQNVYKSHRLTVDICASILFLLYFHYLCLSTWYNINDTKAAGWIKRDDIRQGNTQQGKTQIADDD